MTAPSLSTYNNGVNQVSGDQLNTFEQTCDNVSQLRAFIGASGVQIFLRGYTSINDGGQGVFYWNALATPTTNPDDGGITTVVPNGSTQGVWSRMNIGNLVANGSVSVSLGATAPNGANSTPKGWLKIPLSASSYGYIPYF